MEIVLIWLAFAVVTGIAATGRGRSFAVWFLLGLLFSIFALIAVLVMPHVRPESAPAPVPRRAEAPVNSYRRRALHTLVKIYKGHSITRDGEFYAADGRNFETVLQAERWIDQTYGQGTRLPPASTPAPTAPTAPTAAARLLGDGAFDQVVVGTRSYQPAMAAFASAARGRKALVTLHPQPDNPHDAQAVMVTHGGATLGYLPREDAQAFHEDMAELGQKGGAAQAWARAFGGTEDKPAHGLRLDMVWPLETAD